MGVNAFTYCENNPVNYIDPAGASGYWAYQYIYELGSSLAGLMTGISAVKASLEAALATVSVPVVCIAALTVAITAAVVLLQEIHEQVLEAEQVVDWVKAQVKARKLSETQLSGYTVYVIALQGTTDVVYVGMTRNYASRNYRHQRHPEAKYPVNTYDMIPIATGLTYKEARALEQTLITAYTLDALKNMINSISEKNPGKFLYEFARMETLIANSFIPD